MSTMVSAPLLIQAISDSSVWIMVIIVFDFVHGAVYTLLLFEELMDDEAMFAELEADQLEAGVIPGVDEPQEEPEQLPGAGERRGRKRTRNPQHHEHKIKARAYNTGRRRVSGETVRPRRPQGRHYYPHKYHSTSHTGCFACLHSILFLYLFYHPTGKCPETCRLHCYQIADLEQARQCNKFWRLQYNRTLRYDFINRMVKDGGGVDRRRGEGQRVRRTTYKYHLPSEDGERRVSSMQRILF